MISEKTSNENRKRSDMQKTIVCYGDSNTWGYVPALAKNGKKSVTRFARNERWPGILQNLLGNDYHIVEEGLNGRTTNINYHIAPDRNGKTYLPPCLYTHAPIDLIILSLGINDLKTYFARTAENIMDGLADLINIIQGSKYGALMQQAPNILIMPSPIPLPISEEGIDENGILFFKGAIKKAEQLVQCYEKLAQVKQCDFLNITEHVTPSEIDGCHFDKESHQKIAALLAAKIKKS